MAGTESVPESAVAPLRKRTSSWRIGTALIVEAAEADLDPIANPGTRPEDTAGLCSALGGSDELRENLVLALEVLLDLESFVQHSLGVAIGL